MKRYFLAIAMVTLLVGCNEKITLDSMEGGTINPVLTSDVEISVFTKGSTTLSADAAKNYNLKITKPNLGVAFEGEYSTFDPTKTYSAATGYTIEAESCTEAEAAPKSGKGCARYYGSNTFNVVANQSNSVTVECSMANSKAGVVFDQTFIDVFDEYSVEITVGERSATYQSNTLDTDAFYFNIPEEGATLSYTITGTFNGTEKKHNGTVSKIEKAKYVKLTIKANITNGTIGAPTITVDNACTEQSQDVEVNPYA